MEGFLWNLKEEIKEQDSYKDCQNQIELIKFRNPYYHSHFFLSIQDYSNLY